MEDTMIGFTKELQALINKHGVENTCDIPDFLLAELVVAFIQTVGVSVKKTLDWHGCNSVCHPKTDRPTFAPLIESLEAREEDTLEALEEDIPKAALLQKT